MVSNMILGRKSAQTTSSPSLRSIRGFCRYLVISIFLLVQEILIAVLNAESFESLHLAAPE